ncbi:helix-turn-helix domain-containing protein [Maribacter sp. 2307ULW6-5]|uniref:helix-turn-helix domain-containing protein n=1 Tax=Maribacter sp. 2307ULW6-5 TaxID=3386275 RepID=UPI0039BC6A2A
MQTLKLTQANTETIFKELQSHLGGRRNSDQKEHILNVDNDKAFGEVTGVEVNKHILLMEYDLTFLEDTQVECSLGNTNPIHFLYCAEGQISHSFTTAGKKRSLNQFQTGIFASDPKKETTLFFRKGQKVQLTCIMVNTGTGADDGTDNRLLQQQLANAFMPQKESAPFAYIGSYNLKISEQIAHLQTIRQKGIVRRLLIKGIVHMILALEIEQHKEDMERSKNQLGSLTRDEMARIKDISTFIKNYPEVAYSLKYLSGKTGLSPAKLQEGFKLLHNRTVSDFIRNVRVETAEHLIKTTDLNISEIVYTVGLTSRSYFSKIFKEKYHCSPKHYQDNQNRWAQVG